jgi:hypothetical protein
MNLSDAKRQGGLGRRRELSQLYSPITEFFVGAGFSDSEIIAAIKLSVRRANKAKRPFKIIRTGDNEVVSTLVRRWQTQQPYLNELGRPARLRVSGKSSFYALAKEAGYSGPIEDLIRTMTRFGSLRKRPNDTVELVLRHMNFRLDSVMAYEMNHRFMADAIAVMTRGMGGVGNSKKLYGFMNVGRRIPGKHVSSFLADVRKRNSEFVDEISFWLDHYSLTGKNSGRHKGATYRLGIGVFPVCIRER